MVDANVGNLVKQLLRLLGVLVDPSLALGKELGAAALHHVAEQGPGSAAEANKRYSAGELLPREGDGLVDVVELLGDIDVALHHKPVLLVLWRLERVREVRALLVDHLNNHAHSLGDDKNIRKDDGGIEQTGISLDGLQSEGRGNLGVAAAFEKVSAALRFMVLGQVASG